MGEQRGLAPLLTVDLAPVTVELNLRESGARFPCKWSSVLEIYSSPHQTADKMTKQLGHAAKTLRLSDKTARLFFVKSGRL